MTQFVAAAAAACAAAAAANAEADAIAPNKWVLAAGVLEKKRDGKGVFARRGFAERFFVDDELGLRLVLAVRNFFFGRPESSSAASRARRFAGFLLFEHIY